MTLTVVILAAGCSGPASGPAETAESAELTATATATVAAVTSAEPTTSTPPMTASAVETTVTTPGPGSSGPDSAGQALPVSAPVPISDPPQTGLPGAADSPFCRAYGTMVFTDHLVGLVEAFGDDAGARRAEALAAPALLAAFDLAVAALGEIGPTDDAFAERWSGAADRARTVIASGVPTADFVVAWERVLETHDRNDPGLVLVLPRSVSAVVDTAAAALEAAHGPLADDGAYRSRSLLATPDVDRYAAERCPEVAEVSTGDAV